MNQILIIPATLPDQPSRFLKKPGRHRVFGYANVVKKTAAGVQVRKHIRKLIKERMDWDLIEISTDYCDTEKQSNFLRLLSLIKHDYIDVLIIYAGNDLKGALAKADLLFHYCKYHNVDLNIAHNNELLSSLSEKRFML